MITSIEMKTAIFKKIVYLDVEKQDFRCTWHRSKNETFHHLYEEACIQEKTLIDLITDLNLISEYKKFVTSIDTVDLLFKLKAKLNFKYCLIFGVE